MLIYDKITAVLRKVPDGEKVFYMLLVEYKIEEKKIVSIWNLTYKADWAAACRAAYTVYDKYQDTEIYVDEKPVEIKDREDLLSLKKAKTLAFGGLSTILKAPLMIRMYGGSNTVEVQLVVNDKIREIVDYQKLNILLEPYLSSIEINICR